MMIGKNSICVCCSEMYAALQYYLNKAVLKDDHTVKVTGLKDHAELGWVIDVEDEVDVGGEEADALLTTKKDQP